MREPQMYESTPVEVEVHRRKGLGRLLFSLVFGAITLTIGVAVTTQQSGLGIKISGWAVVLFGSIATMMGYRSASVLADGLNQYRDTFRPLLDDYREARDHSNRYRDFMLYFPTSAEDVESTLRTVAYRVLAAHRSYEELQEKGVNALASVATQFDSPDALRESTDARLTNERLWRNARVQDELKSFRELRDCAKWAGKDRYKVHESWWDYIAPNDLPKQVKRGSATPKPMLVEGANEPVDDGGPN